MALSERDSPRDELSACGTQHLAEKMMQRCDGYAQLILRAAENDEGFPTKSKVRNLSQPQPGMGL